MNPWLTILFTIGLLFVTLVASQLVGFNLVPIMIMLSALWAAFDSSKLQLKKYKSGIAYGPVVLFLAIAFLWIGGFPWYLIVRHRIKSGKAQLKEEPATNAA